MLDLDMGLVRADGLVNQLQANLGSEVVHGFMFFASVHQDPCFADVVGNQHPARTGTEQEIQNSRAFMQQFAQVRFKMDHHVVLQRLWA